MNCSRCSKNVHYKDVCSGETKKSIEVLDRGKWVCLRCTEEEAERESRKHASGNGEEEIEYVTKNDVAKRDIRILQWNADALLAKKEELKNVVNEEKIDIFMVQETKMTEKDRIPIFPEYTILSKPRKQPRGKEKDRGGGLLTGIKNNIPYTEVKNLHMRDINDGITESQTIEIPLAGKDKWRLTNLYIPSERAGDCRESVSKDTVVSTKKWPDKKYDLIAGDFNAHSITWDNSMLETDNRGIDVRRGEMIDEWMEEKDMDVLNSGEPTHTDRKTGKKTAPDITIVHGEAVDKYDWKVLEKLGASDHNPIVITRKAEGIN